MQGIRVIIDKKLFDLGREFLDKMTFFRDIINLLQESLKGEIENVELGKEGISKKFRCDEEKCAFSYIWELNVDLPLFINKLPALPGAGDCYEVDETSNVKVCVSIDVTPSKELMLVIIPYIHTAYKASTVRGALVKTFYHSMAP